MLRAPYGTMDWFLLLPSLGNWSDPVPVHNGVVWFSFVPCSVVHVQPISSPSRLMPPFPGRHIDLSTAHQCPMMDVKNRRSKRKFIELVHALSFCVLCLALARSLARA